MPDRESSTTPKPAMEMSEDRLFAGALRLAQPLRGHRAGTDAILLAAATPAGATRIADLGAATGAVGLRAAQIEPGAHVILIEREPELATLANRNILENGLAGRVETRLGDGLALAKAPDLRERFDAVLTNPPYLEPGRARVTKDPLKARAHVMEASLDLWARAAATLLAPRGRLVMIHRADALPEILPALARRFGGVCLRFIHPEAETPAIRVLAGAVKGSRAPITVLPPIILHAAGGEFTPEARALHEGTARITLANEPRGR